MSRFIRIVFSSEINLRCRAAVLKSVYPDFLGIALFSCEKKRVLEIDYVLEAQEIKQGNSVLVSILEECAPIPPNTIGEPSAS